MQVDVLFLMDKASYKMFHFDSEDIHLLSALHLAPNQTLITARLYIMAYASEVVAESFHHR